MNSGPIDPSRIQSTTGAADDAQRTSGPATSSDGALFRALLDQLAGSAEKLRQSEGSVTDAASLAGAVEDARSTLDDALSLQEQLLEAYRQRRAQGA
ncbi:hypothetical protein Pla163_36980 [Planctomycetes bacterium Pla163]|jgi:hypothetical protein|uniref:Uncharacterized protein n=1 Tax=Rohdeia mirabilis TaxID=2528008 RepID=A0A518D4Z5_9BACT|nr:hypothetical protein Pla163_36980 [Planctomycetes bacterium Pla163]